MKCALLSLLLVFPLVSSCQSSKESEPVTIKIEPGITTKEDMIRQLGPPRGIRQQGEDKVMVFSYGELSGNGYGLGGVAASLLYFEATHTSYDNLEVVIGKDRKVRSFRLATNPRETPVWITE